MFPGAHASVYRNEEGEVLGWDSAPYDDEPDDNDFPPDDYVEDDDEGDDEDDDEECPGHESLRGDAMGDSVYCDGACLRG